MVSGCRHKHTHFTMAHLCGTCNQYGHGQVECVDAVRRSRLQQASDAQVVDVDARACSVDGCEQPYSHTKEAHSCRACGTRATSCPCLTPVAETVRISCPTCKRPNDVDMTMQVFTGATCVVCMDDARMVIFSECKHANVCKACAQRIASDGS